MSDIATMKVDFGPIKKGTVLRILEWDVATAIGKMDKVRWTDENNNVHDSLIRRKYYTEAPND